MEKSHYLLNRDRLTIDTKVEINYLLCEICQNILYEPEKCKSCSSHFCKFCIHFSQLKCKNCPVCHEIYVSDPPDSFLYSDLLELKVKCIHSINGCTKFINYSDIFSHEENCIYKEKTCEECNAKILKKNYHTHIILCKNSLENNLLVDYNQIINYFNEKLNKIEQENLLEIEKAKKQYEETLSKKEEALNLLISKMEKQQLVLEELVNYKQKNQIENEANNKFNNDNCLIF